MWDSREATELSECDHAGLAAGRAAPYGSSSSPMDLRASRCRRGENRGHHPVRSSRSVPHSQGCCRGVLVATFGLCWASVAPVIQQSCQSGVSGSRGPDECEALILPVLSNCSLCREATGAWLAGGWECVWAEVMESRARMGGGSGLFATQTVPQGLSSCSYPDTPSHVLSLSCVPLLTSSQTLYFPFPLCGTST